MPPRFTEKRSLDVPDGLKFKRLFVGIALTGVVTLLGVAEAQAVTYRGEASTQAFSNNTQGGTTTIPASYSISDPYYGSSSVSMSDARGGTISAQSDGSTASVGVISYNFQIVGDSDIFVPIHVQAYGYATGAGTPNFQSDAKFQLYYHSELNPFYGETVVAEAISNNYSPVHSLYDSFTYDKWLLFESNSVSEVSIVAQAASSSTYTSADPLYIRSSATAFIDPTFTIDPAFASRFTITGVPGAGSAPASSVPEAASWAMMVGGLGLVGGTLRRRRYIRVAHA